MDRDRAPDMTPLRFLALGDCNTEGCARLPRDVSLPELIAKSLHARGKTVDVHNGGLTMSTTREGLARVRGESLSADIVLINFGLVDAWVTTIPRIYIPYYPDSFLRKWGRKLLKTLKRRLRQPWLKRLVPTGEVVPLDEYRQNIKHIIETVRSANPQATVVLWGTVPVLHDADRNRKLIDYNAALRELATTSGGIYLDTEQIIGGMETNAAYLDLVHLNEPALRRIATAIVDRLDECDRESAETRRAA